MVFNIGEFVALKGTRRLYTTRYGKTYVDIDGGSRGFIVDAQQVYIWRYGRRWRYQVEFPQGKFWCRAFFIRKECKYWGNIKKCEQCNERFKCFTIKYDREIAK